MEEVNEQQKALLVDKVKRHFGSDLSSHTFALWGLSFKPRTDDIREAPSITVIESLLQAGAEVRVYDPAATDRARKIFGRQIQYASHNYEVLQGSDALLIVTEWNEFRRPNFPRMRELLKNPVVFDGRNIYDPSEMKKLGFVYYSIGHSHG